MKIAIKTHSIISPNFRLGLMISIGKSSKKMLIFSFNISLGYSLFVDIILIKK